MTDVGAQLAGLASKVNAMVRPRIEFDLEIGYPDSRVRMDAVKFDTAILELIETACAAEARSIVVRGRNVGSRYWILICDDGVGMTPAVLEHMRGACDTEASYGTGLPCVHQFLRTSYAQMRIRTRPLGGTSVAVILPALPSLGADSIETPTSMCPAAPPDQQTVRRRSGWTAIRRLFSEFRSVSGQWRRSRRGRPSPPWGGDLS
jgi:signal transduction histidine kinase